MNFLNFSKIVLSCTFYFEFFVHIYCTIYKSALDFIIDALQYIVSIQDGSDKDKKYAALASSVNSDGNTKVYAAIKQKIKDLMKLSNEYFDIRHNDYLNDARKKENH